MSETAIIILAAGKGSRMKSGLPKVLHKINDKITILGIILTMFDKRNKLSFEIESEIKKYFDALLLGNIPRSIRIAEAPSHGMPIQIYDKNSPGAQAYCIITSKILEKIENIENS